jgi:retron-type reverse transcriptase
MSCDRIEHSVLLSMRQEGFADNRFLRLMHGLLKAGYLEEWTFNATHSGVPQGGVVTPLTKLQTFFFEVCFTREGIDPKDDLHMV